MNPKWLALAAGLLERASEEFGNHGCNDMFFPDDWSADERRDFLRAMAEANGTPEDFDPGQSMLMDWEVMGFLARRLGSTAGEEGGVGP